MEMGISKIVDWLVKHIKGYNIKEEKVEEDVEDVIGALVKYVRGSEEPKNYTIETLNLLMECLKESDAAKRARVLTTGYTGLFTEVDEKKFDKIWYGMQSDNINDIFVLNDVRYIWDLYIKGIIKYVIEKIIPPDFEGILSYDENTFPVLSRLRDTCAEHRPDLVEKIDEYIDYVAHTTIVTNDVFYAGFDMDNPNSKRPVLCVKFSSR